MTVESDNAKEEIKEIIESCMNCGKCNLFCPVLKVMQEEQYSARGQVIMLNNDHFDKIVYNCTLCKACERQCPLNLKLCDAIVRARKVLVEQKKELPANKEMVKNCDKIGNVYGEREKKTS